MPQARAQTGDGCPGTLEEAAQDQGWLRDRIQALPDVDGTAGVFYDEDGMAHDFQSGSGEQADTALEVGREIGIFPKVGRLGVIDHVEVKVAAAAFVCRWPNRTG